MRKRPRRPSEARWDASAGTQDRALDHVHQGVSQPETGFSGRGDKAVDFGAIKAFHASTGAVGQQFLDDGAGEAIFVFEQDFFEAGDVFIGVAVGQFS